MILLAEKGLNVPDDVFMRIYEQNKNFLQSMSKINRREIKQDKEKGEK